MKQNDRFLFEEMPVSKAVIKMSVPMVFSSLVMVIYSLADTYFVGMLNDPIQNAAVTLAAPVLLAFNAVNNLFGVGSSSMMSRALGMKKYEDAYKSSAFGFYSGAFLGLIFSIVYTVFSSQWLTILGATAQTSWATASYMRWTVTFGVIPAILNVILAYMVRAEGASLHASIGTMSGCALNIVLDPIFILPWGLNMGAAGAGLATCISNGVACCYFFILIYHKRKYTYVCLKPSMYKFEPQIIKGVCSVGIPAAIQNLLNVTGMTILNNFTAGYGADAVAAMGIAQRVGMIPIQASMGISQGIMPLIGYNFAGRNIKRMKEVFVHAIKISISAISVMAAAFIIFSDQVIMLFMKNTAIVEYGGSFLKGFSLALPFLCMDFMVVGVFQACGMGKKAFIFAILRKIVLEIPAIYILNRVIPLYGMPYAQFVAEFTLAIVAIVIITRFFRENLKQGNIK